MSSKRRKIVIDCDAGIDDAQAIMLALSLDVEVVAITCVAGNVSVDQVAKNVLRILDVCGRTDIPVYKGADRALLGQDFELPVYHGEDGLGDATDAKEPDLELLQPTHAVTALIDIVKQNPGEITIAALAPLTNLALALRMDDSFSKNLKCIDVMGGNKQGIGNHFISAEFNFGADPEAAYVVLEEFECPITITSWEFCLEHTFEWDFFSKYTSFPSAKSQFLKSISTKIEEHEDGNLWMTCDPFAVATAVCPHIVTSQKALHATIELGGQVTRGMMVVDWRNFLQKRKNINLIEKVDLDQFKALLLKSVQ
ncbi:inosine-uridine preferring nucleoside hydrolase [Exaiptasia diaphana]|uniref:Inosine/uridine-preferring nucleoside hydrolase domain-containing protein n=1 Tax=Exaiptasia diaphana TaxID=2652724 RepID=A0A913Y0P3_EXADI|nr:inosine-uridine preferring nucleoside hydrolase [Exaiptasia diaphana]KXJ23351.1 Inosine-uridine preferring nucleoside hydrolase [Exaiptasia diaphana]